MNKEEKVFWVLQKEDSVILKIKGRASFSNASCVRVFFRKRYQSGMRCFIVDFQECTSMDSTFLGVLAALALKLLQEDPSKKMVLSRLSTRNCELISNLGLHRIASIQDYVDKADDHGDYSEIKPEALSKKIHQKLVREAHESLVEADSENAEKFQDLFRLLEEDDT